MKLYAANYAERFLRKKKHAAGQSRRQPLFSPQKIHTARHTNPPLNRHQEDAVSATQLPVRAGPFDRAHVAGRGRPCAVDSSSSVT